MTETSTTDDEVTVSDDAPTILTDGSDDVDVSGGRRWKLERRLEVTAWQEVGSVLAGVIVAVLLCSALIALAGSPVLASYRALLKGAFGTENAIVETLVQATPLIFTGLAAAFAFRAKIWNIGGEGQLWAGAIGCYFVYDLLGSAPRAVALVAMMIGGMVFGAAWAGIAVLLRNRFGVSEVISTVMLNFIIINITSYLLSDLWRDPASFYYQSALMTETGTLPGIWGTSRLHLGFVLALVMAALVWFVLERTSFGYEIRAVGVNSRVASYGGINGARILAFVMLASGAIAGLAGASELSGIHQRLQLGLSASLGFTGIIIALVARLRPGPIIIAAIAAGALTNGATTMQLTTGVPAALADVIKGMALVCVLIAAVAVNYRLRRVDHGE